MWLCIDCAATMLFEGIFVSYHIFIHCLCFDIPVRRHVMWVGLIGSLECIRTFGLQTRCVGMTVGFGGFRYSEIPNAHSRTLHPQPITPLQHHQDGEEFECRDPKPTAWAVSLASQTVRVREHVLPERQMHNSTD